VTTERHAGLEDLLGYPLMSAIMGRRSRRVSRGTSVTAGPLSHESTNPRAPLSELEEAVLIVSTGLTGITHMDGPLDIPDGGKELGSPFINTLARAGASPDNSQPTHFFMSNDTGTFLIKRLEGRAGLDTMKDLPPRWADWTEGDWLGVATAVKHKLFDRRIEFPREFPFFVGWNKQLSNWPGSTMFLPVVDCTRMCINGMLNLLAEPDGQRPLFIDEWQKFRPRTLLDWAAWAGGLLGITEKIPYQPIGGVKRARGGFVNPKIVIPLGYARCMFADQENFFLQQNLMLVAEAMGLGSWIHASPQSPYAFQRDAEKGHYGLGFRFHEPERKWRRWPPVPASQPNPVGLDGVLEGLCPPYVDSMDDAVDRLLEQKFGNLGAYGDTEIFSRSYRDARSADQYLGHATHYPPEAIRYTKDICNYLVDTYGRFPAHVDAFYLPSTWLQVCHVELEYYDKQLRPELYPRQRQHRAIWGH
jgi:hypothetical protein